MADDKTNSLEQKAVRLRGYLVSLRQGFDQAAGACPVSDGITASEMKAMELLTWQGPAMMSRVAAHLGLAVSSTTSVVDRLEAKGLVTRQRDENDRRVVTIHLSEGGKMAALEYAGCYLDFCRAMLLRLGPEDQDTLLELFHKLSQGGPSQA